MYFYEYCFITSQTVFAPRSGGLSVVNPETLRSVNAQRSQRKDNCQPQRARTRTCKATRQAPRAL